MDLRLDIINRIGGLNLQGNGLSSQCLDENLHSSTETEDQVKSRFLLDVVVREGAAIFQLLACKDQTLLVRGNPAQRVNFMSQINTTSIIPFLVLDLCLDIVDSVRGFNLECDGLAGERFHKDLHSKVRDQSLCNRAT